MLHRYRTVLTLLLALTAMPAIAQEIEPGSFEPLRWRPETPWDDLWSTRWNEGIFITERLSLRSLRGGPQDQVSVAPGMDLLVATRNIQNIAILPPRYYTPAEYAHDALAMEFGRTWRVETLKTVKGDPTLEAQRQSQGGFNLELPVELPSIAASIFGEGAPNLRISGSERITIGGTSSWRSPEIETLGRKRSLFPTLEMRQELNVRLNGTIGDKLHIDINQNSEASTSLENQIKIYYQGYDDDVVQRVDLGNTNLTLPRSTYVSASTRQEGLFGVKMTGRLASWDFAMLASKQEGQGDVASFSGGSQETKIGGTDGRINDVDFERRKYYFLTDPDSAEARIVNGPDLEVFVSTRNVADDNRNGRLTFEAELSVTGSPDDTLKVLDNVVLLAANDNYFFLTDTRSVLPVIVLRSPLQAEYRLGVRYRYRNSDNTEVTVGTYPGPGQRVNLQMIKPAWDDIKGDDLKTSPWRATRNLEAKHVYNIGAQNIDPGLLTLNIRNSSETNQPAAIDSITYLEICGLDLINNSTGQGLDSDASTAKGPDGLVDADYIDETNGYIFFPDLRPFDPSYADLNGNDFRLPIRREPRRRALGHQVVEGGVPRYVRDPARASETNPKIYDSRDVKEDYRKYYLDGTYKAFATEINLNRPGILENSETVRMDSEVLVRGVDYNITYETGQVKLISPKAQRAQGQLQITYAYTPLFTQGNRSLMGFSTTYGGSPDFDLSTTFLYETKGSTETRPRLQQEPSRTMLADLSGSWRTRPWVLTRIADALPLVQTNAPSNLTFTGAVGMSKPNPNTKNTVYVDDMEGSIQTTSAGIGQEAWQWSSRPADGDLRDEDRLGFLWFPVQRQVLRGDLSPELATAEKNDYISVLGIILAPNPEVPPGGRAWAGITHVMSSSGLDLSEAQYLEIWINDFNRFHGPNAHEGLNKFLKIDIGSVSEDAVWDPKTPPAPANNALDTEDQNDDGQRTLAEDVGLDTLSTAAEIDSGVPIDSTDYSPSSPEDPAGDDYVLPEDVEDYSGSTTDRLRRFRKVNGTENNQRIDTEALNDGGTLDIQNDYLELKFELGSDEFTVIDVREDHMVLDPSNGWRLLRIPLNHPTVRRVGIPDLNTIKHMRIWFDGFADTAEFQVASIDIVGNRWERQPIRLANGTPISDSTQFVDRKVFNVATVDNKENAGIYSPPFVPRQVDRVTELERSLNLQIENIEPGEQVSAFRSLVRDEDYTLYQVLQFYLQYRSDPTASSLDSLEFFLRFTSTANADTTNTYEISRLLDQEDNWQTFDLPMTELSDLKIGLPPAALANSDSLLVDTLISNGWRAKVIGQPSFSQLRRLQVGLRNVGGTRIVKREVWFNELRLGEVRRDTGLAGRGAVSFNMGDLANVSTSIDRRNADFLTLGQSRGSGVATEAFTFSTAANLDKLTPGANIQLPLSFDYRSARNIPKFRANNDIVFDGEDSGLDITENKSRAINLSLRRLSNQYTPWIIRNTIDAMAFRVGTANSYNRATTSVDSSHAVTAGANWSMRIADPMGIPLPARWKLSVIPDNVSASYSVSDQSSVNYNRDAADPTVLKKTRENQLKNEGLGFSSSWHLLPPVTFAISSQRDLSNANFDRFVVKGVDYRPTLKVAGIDFGREVNRTERLTFTQAFNLTSFFRPRLSWTGDYNEIHSPDITTSADTDSNRVDDPDFVPPDLKTIENRSSTQVSWTIPVSAVFRKLSGAGRTAPRTASGAGGTYKPPDSPLAPPPTGTVPPATPVPDPLAPPPDTTGLVPADTTHVPEDGNLDAGLAATSTAAPPQTPPPPTTDPKEIERRRKADEEAKKKEAERLKKEAEQAKKDAEAAAKWEAEEKKRVAKEAEEARKAEEEARKKEAKRQEEAKKKAESTGGIGGKKKKKSEPAPPADSTLAPPTGSDAGTNPSLAPPAAAPASAPGDSVAAPAPTGGLTKAQAEAEARRRQEEAERKAEEERRRKEVEAERARKAAEPPVSLGTFLFRDLIQIGDIRTNFNVTDRNTANRVHGSPDLAYRLGLSSGLEGVTLATGSRVASSNSVSASGNSAITLLKDITVDANFQWTESGSESDGQETRTATTIWPGLRMNLNSLEKKLKLGRFFTSFAASSGYERRSEEYGTGVNRRQRQTTSNSWRPLLQMDANWRNGLRTQFSADRTSEAREEEYQAGTGVVSTHTTNTYRLTMAKSLVARGGLRGGARSTIDLNLDFTYSKDSTFNDFSTGSADNGKATDNFQTRFSTSYRFTTNVSGSMQLNYGQRRDFDQETADRTLGLQATAAITF